jgi:hypothetical protein
MLYACRLRFRQSEYELDFDALTQTNLDSRKLRKIRRKDSMDADSGFAAVVKAKSMAVRRPLLRCALNARM